MENINLPIQETYEDKIKPSKPSWKYTKIIIIVLVIFYLLTKVFTYLVVAYVDIEKEKEIFGNITKLKDAKKTELEFLTTQTDYFDDYDIYIIDLDTENAGAVLGANIYITEKLLKSTKYEEELIFILGHEIEHIKNRDVIRNLAKTLPIEILTILLGGGEPEYFSNLSAIGENYYSRKAEEKADEGGINLLNDLGLNLDCAVGFFERDTNFQIEVLSTHPNSKKRIEHIKSKNLNVQKNCTTLNYE